MAEAARIINTPSDTTGSKDPSAHAGEANAIQGLLHHFLMLSVLLALLFPSKSGSNSGCTVVNNYYTTNNFNGDPRRNNGGPGGGGNDDNGPINGQPRGGIEAKSKKTEMPKAKKGETVYGNFSALGKDKNTLKGSVINKAFFADLAKASFPRYASSKISGRIAAGLGKQSASATPASAVALAAKMTFSRSGAKVPIDLAKKAFGLAA